MASFEKIAKSLMAETTKTATAVTEIAQDTALVKTIIQNQDIVIVQNKKMIELLDRLQASLDQKA